MRSLIYSRRYEAFGVAAVLRVWCPDVPLEKGRFSLGSWAGTFDRADLYPAHPWRTINVVRKFIKRRPSWECVWRAPGYVRMSCDDVWDHFKLASCERDHLDPANDARLIESPMTFGRRKAA